MLIKGKFAIFMTLILLPICLAQSPIVGSYFDISTGEILHVEETPDFLYFSTQNQLFALYKNGSLAWQYQTESPINGFLVINDVNYDGFKDLFVYEVSFIKPGNIILSGKTGDVVKSFSIIGKTYSSQFIGITTGAVNFNNEIIFSNLVSLYKLKQNGEYEEKIKLPCLASSLKVVGGNLLVMCQNHVYALDNNFKIKGEIKTRFSPIFGKNYLAISEITRMGQIITIYDQNLHKVTQLPLKISNFFGDYIVNTEQNKLTIYDIYGTSKFSENFDIGSPKFAIRGENLFYYKNNTVIKLDSSLNKYPVQENMPPISEILGEDLYLKTEDNYYIVFHKNNSVETLSKEVNKNYILLGDSELIIDAKYPFAFKFKDKFEKIDDEHVKTSIVSKLEKISDLNNDGLEEVVAYLTPPQSQGNDIGSLAIIYPLKGSYKLVNFIPTPEEAQAMIQNLTQEIQQLNSTIESKQNTRSQIENQLADKNSKLSQLNNLLSLNPDNETLQQEVEDLQDEINDLENQVSALFSEIRSLENLKTSKQQQLFSLQQGDITAANSIQEFTILDKRYVIAKLRYGVKKYDLINKESQDLQNSKLEVAIFLDNAKDINSNGHEDIFYITLENFGVIDGNTLDTIWEKNFTISYWEIENEGFIFGNYVYLITKNKIYIFSKNTGQEISSSQGNVQKIKQLNNGFAVIKDGKLGFVVNGQFKNCDIQTINLIAADCDNDGNLDILSAALAGEPVIVDTGGIRKIIHSGTAEGPKVKCYSTSCSEIKEYADLEVTPEDKVKGNFLVSKSKFGGAYLNSFPPLVNFYRVTDLSSRKTYYVGSYPYMENGKLKVNGIEVQDKDLISNPADQATLYGDFELKFTDGKEKLVYVKQVSQESLWMRGEFYTMATSSAQMQLLPGENLIKVIEYDNGIYYTDAINVTVIREFSLLWIIFPIIIIIVIVLSVIKWKRLKR